MFINNSDLEFFRECCRDSRYHLRRLAKENKTEVRATLHWTLKDFYTVCDEYHINIFGNGDIVVTEPRLHVVLPHIKAKVRGNFAIALCCGKGMSKDYRGECPPTDQQIETMAQLIAVASHTLKIPIDVHHFPSHGEAADNEDYVIDYKIPGNTFENSTHGPKSTFEVWDLCTLWNMQSISPQVVDYPEKRGENIIRNKAIEYYKDFYKDEDLIQ